MLAASLVAVSASGMLTSLGASGAGAAGTHRALVIVDTGTTTYQRVITFDSDSITGIQALDLAGANPVVYTFSGQGGAVCRLFGVGRDAGPNCLGGADGDNRYWAYFRAPNGTSSFTYSRAGAGSTQVHDGDVEGWKFGTGQAPAWSPLPAPPTTTTAPPPPPPPVTSPPSRTGPGATGGNGGTGGPAAGPPAGATPEQIAAYWALMAAAGTTTSTTRPLDATPSDAAVLGRKVTRSSSHGAAAGPLNGSNGDGDDGGGSLAAFAIVAAALVGGGLLVRRLRRPRGLA
jgi:hypothetical protein